MPSAETALDSYGRFAGYACVFNQPDIARDVVLPGAFAASLRRRPPAEIRLLWQHDATQPAGVWTQVKEDPYGLYAEGALILNSRVGRESFVQLCARALDGLSIGFYARKAWRDRRTGSRFLREIDLIEISLVTFPMHPQARVRRVQPHI